MTQTTRTAAQATAPDYLTPEAEADARAVLTAALRALDTRVSCEAWVDHDVALAALCGRLERVESWGETTRPRGGRTACA